MKASSFLCCCLELKNMLKAKDVNTPHMQQASYLYAGGVTWADKG